MSSQLKYTITTVSACLLLCLFLYTASSKLLDFAGFERVLRKSPLLTHVARPIAVLVPFSEVVVSLALFLPGYRKTGFALSFVLLFVFTAYIGYMLLFTPKLPCSCGGALKQLTWTQHLFFNVAFLLLSIGGYRLLGNKNRLFTINSFLRKKQAMPKTCLNE